jgi:O-antigen/teichoic acid export membrane protein
VLNATSVKTRFLVSFVSNIVRGVIGQATGLLVARGLNPSGYGDLMFLLGSFVAIRTLLDMGTSNAFYTFLSRHKQERRFYLSYFAWLALQFTFTFALVVLIIPDNMFDKIWLGHNREIVVIAFLAAFMQQQVWQTVGQISESIRKTVKLQLLNLGIAVTYLAIILLLLFMGAMTVTNILFFIIVQYIVATLVAYRLMIGDQAGPVEKDTTLRQIGQEYWVYCKPLVVLSLVAFLYEFADKWMLQKFGGAAQQGYFQIANQISTISLFATTSILSIFWKEVSSALAKQDHARVAMLYRKISRGLVMLGAIISGLLIPWSEQIIIIFLGKIYAQAWPVLAIMLLYPIHQSMGQIAGTMFFASGQTRKYMFLSMGVMLLFLPISYLLLAPVSGVWIPGMGMGAIGIAIKMVLLAVVAGNIQMWVVARFSGWKFEWVFQVVGIPLMLGLGYLTKMLVALRWDLDNIHIGDLIIPVMLSSFIYAILVVWVVWLLPWLIGMERKELLSLIKEIRKKSD